MKESECGRKLWINLLLCRGTKLDECDARHASITGTILPQAVLFILIENLKIINQLFSSLRDLIDLFQILLFDAFNKRESRMKSLSHRDFSCSS
jgi:hypothetical protein